MFKLSVFSPEWLAFRDRGIQRHKSPEFRELHNFRTIKQLVSLRKVLKTLHTIVCLTAFVALPAVASTQGANSNQAPNKRLTNQQLVDETSDKELRLWVHGAFAGLGHGLINEQSPKGDCIWEWYFGGADRFPTIKAAFQKYPDAFPSATIVAISDRVCKT
ncbi:MAG: hypothetical protein AAFW83_01680 [Pseudomonadota bacterium]